LNQTLYHHQSCKMISSDHHDVTPVHNIGSEMPPHIQSSKDQKTSHSISACLGSRWSVLRMGCSGFRGGLEVPTQPSGGALIIRIPTVALWLDCLLDAIPKPHAHRLQILRCSLNLVSAFTDVAAIARLRSLFNSRGNVRQDLYILPLSSDNHHCLLSFTAKEGFISCLLLLTLSADLCREGLRYYHERAPSEAGSTQIMHSRQLKASLGSKV